MALVSYVVILLSNAGWLETFASVETGPVICALVKQCVIIRDWWTWYGTVSWYSLLQTTIVLAES